MFDPVSGSLRPCRREALCDRADLLAHDAVGDLVHPGAAVGLGIAHAEQPQIAPLAEYLGWKALGLLRLLDARGDFGVAEASNEVAQLFVLDRQAEIHHPP
jgi:hypothetical protein